MANTTEQPPTLPPKIRSDLDRCGRFTRSEFWRYVNHGATDTEALELTKFSCSGVSQRELWQQERDVLGYQVGL